ncbi:MULTISPECIES: TadE/TadG family type IV pilus assembly protein [Pelosinus]|uniref:TadE family protein n=1 Tax=Pelosinus fermentans B4 TaxID=1149862 RepID=I8RK22_9FIRM|nr:MULTISPECIES: TadE/TadG family type IV pilus assembly protein [Pelosinus]EIW20448.1 TadE family protein [Pelosinus fermentans B4]EIW25837.1 TadE family protein [Pelosinus fermentans A11]OAM93561.1 TadE family protein [Pelosinus fermentans DSM 17108]SDQ82108.1 Flp pilus assembly protein TadG [Pelosinus fermentans]
MMYFRNNRGQAMVEFAIIIPFFFFMLYACSYLGMFFHDYLILNEMTRNIARQASVGISLDTIKINYSNQTFLTSVYIFDSNTNVQLVTEPENENDTSEGQNVTVTLTASRNVTKDSFWEVLPETISSSLTMRKEE